MSFTPVRVLNVSLGGQPVGRLALVDRQILFEYDSAFTLPLSPFHLPVRPGTHVERRRVFDGLFGVFDDSLPDGWGRLLLDREMDRRGVGRRALTPLDRLAFVGENGAGGLIYHPAWGPSAPSGALDLAALYAESQRVLDGDELTVFADLFAAGGSSGGARPKVLVGWRPADGRITTGPLPEGSLPLLVKFRNRGDPPDAGAIEHAYAEMAREAGIDVPPTWLLGATADHPGFFATRRFDRAPRRHVHTLSGLLHADHRIPSLDYDATLKATRWLTRDQRAVDELFRRMVFNVLAHNRDDHSRNFAFRMDDSGLWAPTPAYDLTFASGPGGEHWMTVAGEGRAPGVSHLLEVARRVGVDEGSARTAIDGVASAVSRWDAIAERSGVGRTSRTTIGRVLGSIVR